MLGFVSPAAKWQSTQAGRSQGALTSQLTPSGSIPACPYQSSPNTSQDL